MIEEAVKLDQLGISIPPLARTAAQMRLELKQAQDADAINQAPVQGVLASSAPGRRDSCSDGLMLVLAKGLTFSGLHGCN